MSHHGDVAVDSTLYVYFDTFDDAGASVTMSGLAVTDIEIYKNGSTTQRSSDSGYTLLDTDGIDFDGLTGIHGFSIDLSDNSDAGFYAAGSSYVVVVSTITVDGQTISFIAAEFRIVGSAIANWFADHIIRRTFANAKATSGPDAKTGRSLLGAIAKLVNKVSISAGTLTVTEEDDSTSLFTQTVTTSSTANPITEADTD